VYDVSYYVTRSNTDFEEFFGPAPNFDWRHLLLFVC
jgi:hypothetical protein